VRGGNGWPAVGGATLACLLFAIMAALTGAGCGGSETTARGDEPLTSCTLEEARSLVDWEVKFPDWTYPGATAGPIHIAGEGTARRVVAVWTLPDEASIQLEQSPLETKIADASTPRSVTVQGAAADLYRHVREDDGALFIHIVWRSGGVGRVLSGYFPQPARAPADEDALLRMAESCR